MKFEQLEMFYREKYKILMFIPVALLVISLLFLGGKYIITGSVFEKDVSLRGGITASIYTDKAVSPDDLSNALGVELDYRQLTDLSSGQTLGFIVEVSDLSADQLQLKLEEFLGIDLNSQNYSVEETDPALGDLFFKQLLMAILFAFVLMAIAVFFTFRTFVPSIAVVFSALTDLTITLVIVNLLGIKLSTAGIVAFLLVIGYSVDTDILMTSRMLREKSGNYFTRLKSSIKTGLTMLGTTLAALSMGFIFGASPVFKQMFLIIIIALIVDVFSTYFTNAGILINYCKKKGIE